MIYVADRTVALLGEMVEHFKKNSVNVPSRVIKADVIHIALEEYAQKLGLKTKYR
jgi:hypothetical protein